MVPPAVQEGVSQELAAYRSAVLSDIRYDIFFRIPERLDEHVTGRETVSFTLARKAPLQLDFRQGSDAVTVLKVNGSESPLLLADEHIVIDRSLLHKGINTVELEFVSSDRSLNRNEEYLYTLFVPDRARTAFPCFDQPDLKGRFTLTLDVPESWEAVANCPEVSVSSTGGRKLVSFKETMPLSTYLFAFAAGLWKKETRTREGKPLSMYYRETDPLKTAQADDIFAQVFASLDWLEDYTGIPCPFEKYDFVVVPGFQFGGMEHPGAILFNDKRIFLPEEPTTSEKLSRIELIAHETSHLWFGDAVTMRWFNDVWTKEVFANFYAAKISSPLFPDVNVTLRDFRNFNVPAYSEDRTAGTNAIRQVLPNLSSAGLVYGNIVYDKAPVVMRMLSEILGDDAFRDGIREYLRTYMYSNADWNDLIAILDRRSSVDLKEWSRCWVSEKGMPVLRYSIDGGILSVRQEDPLGRGLVWPQNVTFGNEAGETVASVWSDASEVSIPLPSGFSGPLFPDPSASSYGCFLLDSLTAHAALESLPSIPKAEARLSLLVTLYENVVRGELTPELFVPALEGELRDETDPLVSGVAAGYLKTLSLHGPLAGSELLEDLLLRTAGSGSLSDEIRLVAFRALAEVFRSDATLSLMWQAFIGGNGFKGLKLNVRDYMLLSYELAVRLPDRYEQIRTILQGRIGNPDLLREFNFVYRAVSPSRDSRDSLFQLLLEPVNRSVEPWASQALSYLNHHLRQHEALGYIRPGLDALPEIQRTGDIFFPKNWCESLLKGHDSPEAAAVVRRFLADNPDFPGLLKSKLLQSADHLLEND